MKKKTVVGVLITLTLYILGQWNSYAKNESVITVNTTQDELLNNNNCSLREAIISANTDTAVDQCPAGSGADTIELPAGTFVITIAGQGENAAQSGDFDLTGDVTITGAGKQLTVIDGNSLDRVFQIFSPADVFISDLTVRGGDTGLGSGPVYSGGGFSLISGSSLSLTDVLVEANVAGDSGGGIYNNAGVTTLIRTTLRQNQANFYAGAIRNLGSLTLIDSTVDDNQSANAGGGIFNTGQLLLNRVTISRNTAGTNGGGLYLHSGTSNLENVTISDNQANASLGGGVWIYYQTEMTATHTTIAYNVAGLGGGIYNTHQQGLLVFSGFLNSKGPQALGNIHLKNTIIAHNTGWNCGRSLQTNPIDTLGHNLDSGMTCEFNTFLGDLVSTDPQLGPLQDNSGLTMTRALIANSPAIDAGDHVDYPATDQRGVPRPIDGDNDMAAVCDIGAFEFDPLQPTTTPTFTPTSTPIPISPTPTFTSTTTASPPTATPTPTSLPPTPTGTLPTPTPSATATSVQEKHYLPLVVRDG